MASVVGEATVVSEAVVPCAPKTPALSFGREILVLREWDRLAGPGATLTGAERVGLAHAARDVLVRRGGTSRPHRQLDRDPVLGAGPADRLRHTALRRAARWVMADAGGITDDFIADLERDGVSRLEFLEVIAVVARLAAIDHLTIGMGLELRPLPQPFRGEPTGRIDDWAEQTIAWVPTVPGPVSAVTILNALPDEQYATFDVHGELYLSPNEMTSNDFEKPLTRAEMEIVAARTSFLNECFY